MKNIVTIYGISVKVNGKMYKKRKIRMYKKSTDLKLSH
jgi:hypothetical protein